MKVTDNGGSAFPVTANLMSSGYADIKIQETTGGMSLRDWFAGMALQGLVAHYGASGIKRDIEDGQPYKLADLMLAARKEGL